MNPLLLTAAIVAGCMIVLWFVSLRLMDSSIVDLFWGAGFVVIAWTSLGAASTSDRSLLISGLTTLWGLRLAIYLTWRNHGRGEDPRYVAMRARHGAAWWWRSFFIVFVFQGALMWVISLPVQLAIGAPGPIGLLELAATLLVLTGVAFESIGDLQLARFKANPANKGTIMNRGLWRYTRHPNYFGDAVVWWGFGLFGLAAGAWWTLIGPALMTFLLVRVSGVSMLEGMMKDRPGYAEYVRSTSAFLPRPPSLGK
jgi:steroid 5-alpha reductase family enzyme